MNAATDEADRRAGQHVPWQRASSRRIAVALAAVVAVAASLAGISVWLPSRASASTTGATGAAPTFGATGARGATGAEGATGVQGVTGAYGATGVVGVASGLGSTGGDGATGAVGPTGDPHYVRPWDGSNPYGGFGRQLTIDELRAEAPYVPLPNSDLANDGNVGTIWVAGQAQINDVSIHYRSQISYGWVRGATVLGYSPDGYGVQTINGVSAVLVKPDGGQEMFRSGLHEDQLLDMAAGPTAYIEIDGPAGELVDVARTLSPMPPDVSPAGDLPPANPQRSGSVTLWDGFFSDPI